MFITERDRLRMEIEELAEELGRNRSALLPLLQTLQSRHNQISDFAMQVVADVLGLHPVEVHSVVTFYSFLDSRPRGEFIIRLCGTVSCMMQGNDRIARQLENDLGIAFGETTPDGKFTLEWANCLGMCDRGPALLVNEKVYTHVTPESVHEVIEACRSKYGVHALQRREDHLV